MNGTHKLEKNAWCPGCGNIGILKCLYRALDGAGVDRHKLVLVSGIGQAAKLPHYTDANVFNGLHGRALPAATGIKMANKSLDVIVTSGDGDLYGEGGNHFVHALRRNIGIKVFAHVNQIYGLTKGQAAPTTDPGMVTKIQTHGVILKQIKGPAFAIAEDVSFVARATVAMQDHLVEMMIEAIKAPGFALLDILTPCVSFNKKNTYQWYRDRAKLLPENYDPTDRDAALREALKWDDEIPVGVLYRGTRPSFEASHEVIKNSKPLVAAY